MDGEITYHQERLDNPRRVFFDLKGARPVAALLDATLKFPDDLVQEIRLGRHPQNTTRVVMDMRGRRRLQRLHSLQPVPCRRRLPQGRRSGGGDSRACLRPRSVSLKPGSLATDPKATAGLVIPSPVVPPAPIASTPIEKIPLPSRAAVPPALSAPAVPSANSNGRFSIARQLGLGVSRVVIDAGHGGHDPGAHGNGINEADLVLDVALRLRKLLADQPGMEVVMTRDTDVFIPLEERTAIANRESADLFLSIHANASRNTKARGIETYFLNFASNPEAAAVAARENSASGKTMHSLPEIVRAITLNNKIDESRDFAELVQKAMVKKLAMKNAELQGSRRQAGAVRGADRRRDAERARGDLVRDPQAGRTAAQDASVSAADCGSAVRCGPGISEVAEVAERDRRARIARHFRGLRTCLTWLPPSGGSSRVRSTST